MKNESMMYMRIFKDFYEAYNFLQEHPIIYYEDKNYFKDCLDVEVVKVNPETNEIDNDKSKNTHTRVWLEFGEISDVDNMILPTHDIEFDCGGDTFEEAIIKLAILVAKKYPEFQYYEIM